MTETRKHGIVSWRTPNEWWFVAMCQHCGQVVSSISDGGAALDRFFDEFGTECKPDVNHATVR